MCSVASFFACTMKALYEQPCYANPTEQYCFLRVNLMLCICMYRTQVYIPHLITYAVKTCL